MQNQNRKDKVTKPTTDSVTSRQDINPLSLDNQICFSLYVCSKEIIRLYTPILEPLGITYTMYIVLMALWEKDNVSVKELGKKVFLDSGTLTPLLKKLEAQELIARTREKTDERSLLISLTEKGKKFRNKCITIPSQMACNNLMDMSQAADLLKLLHSIMSNIEK